MFLIYYLFLNLLSVLEIIILCAKLTFYLDIEKHKNSSRLNFLLDVKTSIPMRNGFFPRNSFLDYLSFFFYLLPIDILIFPYDSNNQV